MKGAASPADAIAFAKANARLAGVILDDSWWHKLEGVANGTTPADEIVAAIVQVHRETADLADEVSALDPNPPVTAADFIELSWDVACLACGWRYTEEHSPGFGPGDVLASQEEAAYEGASHACEVMVQLRPPGETRWSRPYGAEQIHRLEDPF